MRLRKISVLLLFAALLGAWNKHGTTIVPVAPVLSAQSGFADGTDHALLSVSTDTGSGTLYYAISTSCGLSPTAAQVQAGTVSSGDGGDETQNGLATPFTAFPVNNQVQAPLHAQDIKAMTLIGYGLTHSCRVSAGL